VYNKPSVVFTLINYEDFIIDDVTCADNPCQNHRLCLDDTVTKKVVCYCDSKYTGRFCESKILFGY